MFFIGMSAKEQTYAHLPCHSDLVVMVKTNRAVLFVLIVEDN